MRRSGNRQTRFHHATYALDSREEVLRAADIFLENGVHIETGPHKHAVHDGNTSLRYDMSSHQFVQNWKTPTVPGCYLVQVKGDGLLLNTLFKVR